MMACLMTLKQKKGLFTSLEPVRLHLALALIRTFSTEVDRNSQSSSGEDFLINRRIQILHPRGVKWTENNVADVFPTNEELADGSNWERVYEPKAIRIVKFKFKTELDAVGA